MGKSRLITLFIGFAVLSWAQRGLAEQVTVPVQIGLGPAGHMVSGPIFADQWLHGGLKVSIKAIISKELIHKHRNRIPRRWQRAAASISEVRITPFFLIPDTLVISPPFQETGMVGITWRFISLGTTLKPKKARLNASIGLLLSYIYIHSTSLPALHTHFLRPGLDIRIELELPISEKTLLSFGWSSGFYIPQVIGGSFFALTPTRVSIWHIGQPFVMLHHRFPYQTRL